jgi:hypothetical protein
MSSSAPLLNDGNGNWTRYPLHHFDWNADVLVGISNFLTLLYGNATKPSALSSDSRDHLTTAMPYYSVTA